MLFDEALEALGRARQSAIALTTEARNSASTIKYRRTVAIRVAHDGKDPFSALDAAGGTFKHEALAAAGLVGEPWVTVIGRFVDDAQRKLEAVELALRSEPHRPRDRLEDQEDIEEETTWQVDLDARVETLDQLMHTFTDNTAMAVEHAIESARREQRALAKAPKEPAAVAAPENVINVLLNVLHLYQFNVQVINVTLDQTIERETATAPEADRSEFKVLALGLKEALASGDREQVKAALESIRAWVAANPGDRAVAVVGLLLGILGILLALS